MKHFLITILVTALFFQSTSLLWITGAFYLNRQYIAENLCVDRAKPISMCYGSCYLEKQVKEEREKEQKLPDSKVKEILLFCEIRESGEPTLVRQDAKTSHPGYRPDFYQYNFSTAIFHPPVVS